MAAVREGKLRVCESATTHSLAALLEQGVEHLWIDLLAPTAEELAFLRECFRLHPLAIEECDHTGVRPKIEAFEGHLYLVLHGINHNEGAEPLDMVEFKLFLWQNHLITVHDQPSRSIRAAQEYLQHNPPLLAGGADRVLHRIVDAIVDHYFPVLEPLEMQVEKIETELFRDPSDALLGEILRLRRTTFMLQRLIQPQLDTLGTLASGRFTEIRADDLPYFRDVYDHLLRINDRVLGVREMLTAARECHLAQISNRMNAVMKGFALLATVLLPVTVLTSLWGMDLDHLPGRSSPAAFWQILGFSLLITVAFAAVLRRLRWL